MNLSIVSDEFFTDFVEQYSRANFEITNRGGRKLIHNGFSFTVNRKLKDHLISWKCTKYKRYGCKARAVTNVIRGSEFVKLSKPLHTHSYDA